MNDSAGMIIEGNSISGSCTEACTVLSSGTASPYSRGSSSLFVANSSCTCQCNVDLPIFREDLHICVDDIHGECMAPIRAALPSLRCLPDPEDSHLAACWRRIVADPRLPGASWLKSSPAGGLILLHLASSAATVFVLGLKYKLQDWANPRIRPRRASAFLSRSLLRQTTSMNVDERKFGARRNNRNDAPLFFSLTAPVMEQDYRECVFRAAIPILFPSRV